MYTVLARRYRPESFDSLVGQERVAETLKNAIRMGRVGHAYLFCGPRGVGKTSAARILAKALNCREGVSPEPCLKCENCLGIAKGHAVDVTEIDGASNNSVDDVRAIRENAHYAPLSGTYKIYIIDEIHMVTRAGFNALLKILEEPPEHVVFIAATTEAHKIPETVLSRFQRFDFKSIFVTDIAKRLKQICEQESVDIEAEVLAGLATYADGGMRNAQSSLDQLITFAGGEKISARHMGELLGILTETDLLDLMSKIHSQDIPAVLGFIDTLSARNIRPPLVLDQLHRMIRDLMRLKHLGAMAGRGQISGELLDRATQLARDQSDQGFMAAVDLLQNGKNLIQRGLDPASALEMTLINLCQLGQMPSLSELMSELVHTKKKTSG